MNKIIIPVILVAIAAVGLFAINPSGATSDEVHSVEMSVSRLSCGSCVETIREAVTALNGTTKVETDVGSARSYVEFNAEQMDAGQIAETITNAGYPATVLFVKNSVGEVLSGVDLERYVARVGSRLILRDDFNHFFQARLQTAETSGQPVPVGTLSQDAWRSILRQELLLNAAGQFGVLVSDADLETRITELADSFDKDREELRNDMIIDGYLAMQYADKKPNGIEMANLLNKLQSSTAVDIFDKNLNRYLSSGKSGSGCGGSCCG